MTLRSPTVLIVHGAWVDGTSWREVIALLQGRGIRIVVAPVPLTSLGDDTEAAARVIQREHSPIVLVGHGYGGAVASDLFRPLRTLRRVFLPVDGTNGTNATFRLHVVYA